MKKQHVSQAFLSAAAQSLFMILCALLLTVPVLAEDSIEVWLTVPSNSETVTWLQDEFLPRFTAEKGIEVAFTDMSKNRGGAIQQVAAGAGPDIVLGPFDPRLLVPLNRFVDRWPDRRKILPKMLTMSFSNGDIMAITTGLSMYGITYSKRAFTKAGLDPESPPASWEQIEVTANKLMLKLQSRIVRNGFDCSWDMLPFVAFLSQNNTNFISNNLKESRLDSPEFVETVEFMGRLYRMAYPPNKPLTEDPTGYSYLSKFPLGAAMVYADQTIMSRLDEALPGDAFGFFTGQRCASCSKRAIAAYGQRVAIPTTSDNPLAAWTFIEWLMSLEPNLQLNATLRTLSPRVDAPGRAASLVPDYLPWYQNIQYAEWLPSLPVPGNTLFGPEGLLPNQRGGGTFRQLLKGEVDVKTTLYRLDAQFQQELNTYWAEQAKGAN